MAIIKGSIADVYEKIADEQSNLSKEQLRTTILNFRHLLEEHELGAGLFEEINRYLESKGLRLQEGTIVDASIIAGALIGEESG